MAFDWSTLAPQACKEYIRTGRSYDSGDTLAQANQTLQAVSKHAAQLVQHGFGPPDVQRLTDVRDSLEAAGAGRDGDARARKDARRAHREARRQGLAQRQKVRSVLIPAVRVLRETGGPEAEEAAGSVESALEQTARAARDDNERLAKQLDALESALTLAPVVAATADRGGPAALLSLQAARAALRSTDRERPGTRGTPESTEHLDLLDGVAVTLARQAYRAARGLARALEKPALASEFALVHLGKARSKAPPAEDTPDAPEEPTPEPARAQPQPKRAAKPKRAPKKAEAEAEPTAAP